MESLPSLPIGDAWFWSPGWPSTEGIFARVHVLPIETFDSGATPKPGEKRVEPKTVADVDLDALKRQMAATIEKAKAEDPRALRLLLAQASKDAAAQAKRIIDLEARVARASGSSRSSEGPKTVEIPVLSDVDRELLTKLAAQFAELKDVMLQKPDTEPFDTAVFRILTKNLEALEARQSKTREAFLDLLDGTRLGKVLEKVAAVPIAAPLARAPIPPGKAVNDSLTNRSTAPARASMPATSTGNLKGMHRAMLTALAQHKGGLSKGKILAYTGYRSSGPVSSAFADLAREGWVETREGRLVITRSGLDALGPFDPLPTGAELRAQLLNGSKLSTMEKRMLGALFEAYPNDIGKGEMLHALGYASSGPVSSAFAHLVAIDYAVASGSSRLRAADVFFES